MDRTEWITTEWIATEWIATEWIATEWIAKGLVRYCLITVIIAAVTPSLYIGHQEQMAGSLYPLLRLVTAQTVDNGQVRVEPLVNSSRYNSLVEHSSEVRRGRKEGDVLFNDTLNTFFIYGYMALDIW